jgi:hypothetical protein
LAVEHWNILGTADAGPLPEETVVQYHPAAAGVVLRMPDMALPHSLRKIREPHAAGFRNISNFSRLLMTYIIPLLVVGGLILCGLDRSGHPLRYVREH